MTGDAPLHLRVRLRALLVRRAMDPGCPPYDPNCPVKDESHSSIGQATTSPGEWNVYVDAGGVWTPVESDPPPAADGETFRTKQTIDLFLAKGRPWRLFVQTRECDFGSLGNAYSIQGEVDAVPAHHRGRQHRRATTSRGSLPSTSARRTASLGTHQVEPEPDSGSTCPASNTHGCYRLTFTISRFRP